MKKLLTISLAAIAAIALPTGSPAEDQVEIIKTQDVLGQTRPVPVALTGFSGEALEVLKFDLYVQGFTIVGADQAQYLVSGSNSGELTGGVVDKVSGRAVVPPCAYSGQSLRRQAHAFADKIVEAVQNRKGIGLTKIAFNKQPRNFGPGEVYMADYDGYGARAITSDNAIVGKLAWAPNRLVLYYTSYLRDNPDIYRVDLSTGQRRLVAGHSGLNTSAAVSPDGSKIAMVLSKSGSPNVWISDADGSNLRRLTTGIEDSSPCWSPDGKWVCFAMKTRGQERRQLAKIPAAGGEIRTLSTAGTPNPTEPDWSPDGKFIAFTSQMRDFNICVMPADGSAPPTVLVAGQNPSWSPNSRTLIFNHGTDSRQTLSVLDVFTKQYKDCARATGSNSQPAWAK